MINSFFKILINKNNVISLSAIDVEKLEVTALGEKIHDKVERLFRGSLAIRQIDAGSDNACEQELVALSNAFYDIERFGINFVASPKHADMLLITGPLTRNMAIAMKRAYENTPNPKIVVAVGDSAINGGLYRGSYATLDGIHELVSVDYQIPGDPPSPKEILRHLLKILESVEKK